MYSLNKFFIIFIAEKVVSTDALITGMVTINIASCKTSAIAEFNPLVCQYVKSFYMTDNL